MKMQARRVVLGAGTAVALAALLGLPSCASVPQLAPNESTMVLFANPPFIPANGGVSVISAVVTEPAGTPVPDGTVIQFFVNIGKIDREGETKDGVARVNFISDARSGVARVDAVSGANTATLDGGVSVGGVLPARVILTADPSRIVLTTSRSTHIFATVVDADGNPVPNIGVIFTVAGTTELMDSQGHPIFTDTNGRAEDVLRTKRTTPGTARVTATTLDGTTQSLDVPIVVQ